MKELKRYGNVLIENISVFIVIHTQHMKINELFNIKLSGVCDIFNTKTKMWMRKIATRQRKKKKPNKTENFLIYWNHFVKRLIFRLHTYTHTHIHRHTHTFSRKFDEILAYFRKLRSQHYWSSLGYIVVGLLIYTHIYTATQT